MNLRELEINLSYVLHEPAGSRAVARMVREIGRFERKRSTIQHGFGNLSPGADDSRLLVAPKLAAQLQEHGTPTSIVSAIIGLPKLLPGILNDMNLVHRDTSMVMIDNEGNHAPLSLIEFFGAFASLPELSSSAPAVLVCGAIVRPGGESLMLGGELVIRAEHPSEHHFVRSVVRALEGLIRENCDQWTPARALWESPAELTMPEIARHNENDPAD